MHEPGDLIMFVWPDDLTKISEHPDWDRPKVGLLLEVVAHHPGDEKYGDEWLVLHKGERWSVPSGWCRSLKERE
jgi:hypothetical protein